MRVSEEEGGNYFKTGIKALNPEIAISNQDDGNGFTYIVMSKLIVISCYPSGNAEIQELDNMLQEMENRMRGRRTETIITGDFIAKPYFFLCEGTNDD